MGDVVRACRLERAAAAVDAALQCIFQLAVDPTLQARICCRAAPLFRLWVCPQMWLALVWLPIAVHPPYESELQL